MKNNVQTITFGAICLFLCCYFMQIFDFPNVLTVILGGILCLAVIVQQRRIRIDAGFCLLLLTMISYYVIVNGVRGLFFMILYIPPVLYLLASAAVDGIEDDVDKNIRFLIFAFVLGYAVHGLLNSYMYYAGYVIPGTRQWQDFWTGAIVPGTQHTAYFLPVLALFFPALIYFRKRKWSGGLLVVVTVFFGYTSLATKSRMSVMIFAMVFCAQAVLFVLLERETAKKLVSGRMFQAGCIVLVIAVIAGAFAMKDSDVVVAFMENMGKGGGIFHNVRFEAQRLALSQLFDFPLGGRQMELGRTYCHNTWLDMANAGGLIPFFAFTAYTIYTLYELVRLLLKKEIPTETKLMLAGLYGAFFLYLSVEPALDASIHLVTPWIFVNGLIHGRLTWKNRQRGMIYERKITE